MNSGEKAGLASKAKATGLKREIGLWTLVALTINCVVGAGVLRLPGRVFALAGSAPGWVLAPAGLLALAVALCLAELAGHVSSRPCRSAAGRP